MPTKIIDERHESFNSETGEIFEYGKTTVQKSALKKTDEFIKHSKYLGLIFQFQGIPMNLIPISILIAGEMEFKTNRVHLVKSLKQQFAEMLDCSFTRVEHMITDCVKYDILRRTQDRGIYEVNAFLFSTGSIAETRSLQAHFDIMTGHMSTMTTQKNRITQETVNIAVTTKELGKNGQLPGQISMGDLGYVESTD